MTVDGHGGRWIPAGQSNPGYAAISHQDRQVPGPASPAHTGNICLRHPELLAQGCRLLCCLSGPQRTDGCLHRRGAAASASPPARAAAAQPWQLSHALGCRQQGRVASQPLCPPLQLHLLRLHDSQAEDTSTAGRTQYAAVIALGCVQLLLHLDLLAGGGQTRCCLPPSPHRPPHLLALQLPGQVVCRPHLPLQRLHHTFIHFGCRCCS